MKNSTFYKSVVLSVIFTVITCAVSCKPVPEVVPAEETQSGSIIRGFSVNGGDGQVSLKWAPVSSEYDVYVLQKKIRSSDSTVLEAQEPVKITSSDVDGNGSPCKIFSGLSNMNGEADLSDSFFYEYTVSVYKQDELVEEHKAETTVAGSFSFNESPETSVVWTHILSADSTVPVKRSISGVSCETTGNTCLKIAKFLNAKGSSSFINIFNNTSAVTELVKKSGCMDSDEYLYFESFLEDGEEIQWFTVFVSGYHYELYGKIVNTQVEANGYNESTDYEVSCAVGENDSLEALTQAFRTGSRIRTKGYYEEGDGGAALYEIYCRNSTYRSNGREYTRKHSQIKTAAGQYCLLVPENNQVNLVSLGAGKCFQITWEKYADWRAFNTAYKKGTDSSEWESFKSSHSNWKAYTCNDDTERLNEAAGLLDTYRTDSDKTITVFVPAGDYRASSTVAVVWKNFALKGVNTDIRNPGAENTESFEDSYTELSGEKGSSGSGRTVFYTDNGNGGTLNVVGPADHVLVEGITWEAREIDSRRTYWHSADKDSSGNYVKDENGLYKDINYVGRGTCDKSMADEQWYSRQVLISQCSNVQFKNCEFIITRHVRDRDVWPSNLDAGDQNLYDYGGSEYLTSNVGNIFTGSGADKTVAGYQANPYVEWCDIHTDKQFTSMTFYSGWHNVNVDNCLMYNMSAVFRGASMGFLDYYSEQCENGVLQNSVLYHNPHDEMMGVFTLQPENAAFKETESINGAHIFNNKFYILRDEHVDKIKPRVMVSTIGYGGSRNIYDVRIEGNYYYADRLPSKMFTFGCNSLSYGRDPVYITNNTFDMVNGGGSYIAETAASYVRMNNNTFNFKGGGTINSTIIDGRYSGNLTDYEIEFCGNTVNVEGNSQVSLFNADGGLVNGKVNGNTLNVTGSICPFKQGSLWLSVPVTGAREVRNNIVNAGDRMTMFYYGRGKMRSDVAISGNSVNVYGNDYDDDYSTSVNSGGYYGTGTAGYTFVDSTLDPGDGDYKLIIAGNTINAPNCTRENKHLLRYENKNQKVVITNNRLQKFEYLRNVTQDYLGNILFYNNFDNYGRRLEKEDWYVESAVNDTENALYVYDSAKDGYVLSKYLGVQNIPSSYDDGTNGTKPVTSIGDGAFKSLAYKPACTLSSTIVEIGKEAFYNSSSGCSKLPSGLKVIREKAFYCCQSLGETNGNAHYSTTGKLDYKIVIPAGVEVIESKAFCVDDRVLTIYCEADSKPEGWADDWYEQKQTGGIDTISVVWGQR